MCRTISKTTSNVEKENTFLKMHGKRNENGDGIEATQLFSLKFSGIKIKKMLLNAGQWESLYVQSLLSCPGH